VLRAPCYTTFFVDEVISRPAAYRIIISDMPRIDSYWKGDIILGDEIGHPFGSKTGMNTDDGQAFVSEFVMDILSLWQFLKAWPTPNAPEIQEHDFAF